MVTFASPFFSIAGQKERLANVGGTLNAAFNPFSKDKVQADTGSRTTNAVLSGLANHPYAVALVGASIAAPTSAAGAAREVATGTGKLALDTGARIGKYALSSPVAAVKTIAGGAFVAGGGLVLAKPLFKATKAATEKTVDIITGEGEFSPSDLPAIGDSIGSALGFGAAGLVAGAAAKTAYDYLTEDSTAGAASTMLVPSSNSPAPAAEPITRSTQVIGRPASSSLARRKKARAQEGNRVSVRVLNQNTFIGERTYNRVWSQSRRA